MSDVLTSAELLRDSFGAQPFDVAVVLGSGLGQFTRALSDSMVRPYAQIPCLVAAPIQGHSAELVAGALDGKRILAFSGRRHLYQGYSAWEVSASVRLASALGCRRILLTNAVGGIRADLRPGDFCLIGDHLNLTGENPLTGQIENPFVDLGSLYRTDFFPALERWGVQRGIRLHQAVLAALKGPSYETPAEVRMLEILGAEVASMSMVPEAIVAAWLSMEVVGLSMVTNLAAGRSAAPLDHQDVLLQGRSSAEDFTELLRRLVSLWGHQE